MLASNGLEEPSRIQRFYWSITEGAAACSLLYAGRFSPHDDDAQLKALQAVSIVIGLPWTILICLECISLWRACQYEFGDRMWGGGFNTSIVDFGITVFRPSASTGGKVFNCGGGKVDCSKFVDVLLNCIVPTRSIYQILTGIQSKAKVAFGNALIMIITLVSAICYYGWLILIVLDHLPTDDCPYWTQGSVEMKSEKKLSTRYGIFHGWGVDIGPGAMIQKKVDGEDWKWVGLTRCGDETNSYYTENIAVGKRIGSTMRIAVFGWFALFLFVAIVTYLRATVRAAWNKHGNPVEDFLCTLVAWPTVLSQIKDTISSEDAVAVDKPKEI
jgi:hypothetical protein